MCPSQRARSAQPGVVAHRVQTASASRPTLKSRNGIVRRLMGKEANAYQLAGPLADLFRNSISWLFERRPAADIALRPGRQISVSPRAAYIWRFAATSVPGRLGNPFVNASSNRSITIFLKTTATSFPNRAATRFRYLKGNRRERSC
jgi:hypothetical protein